MRIHTLKIRNFRCYGDNTIDGWGFVFKPNTALNLLIGPNGSGKTSLLEALDLTLNPDGHSNQSLITEYDFPYCDTKRVICIEATLIELGNTLCHFESDIQWIEPEDGIPIEIKEEIPDEDKHERAIIIRFEAKLDPEDGELKWDWFLPKFPSTELDDMKKLSRSQHEALGYFRIRSAVSGGAFTLGQYSALGRHLRKLKYKLGKLPHLSQNASLLADCTFESDSCKHCDYKTSCEPKQNTISPQANNDQIQSIGLTLHKIIDKSKNVLGKHCWENMEASLGPRYGAMSANLAALTLGLKSTFTDDPKFIPFERLSSGEKYALSFSLAISTIPGDTPPIVVMEEPETALHPSAIAALLANLRSITTGNKPQVFISSHSESLLRACSIDDIFLIQKRQNPSSIRETITVINSEKNPFSLTHLEHIIKPGLPIALFANKVLIVEGSLEALVIGSLDRLATTLISFTGNGSSSFSISGWSILSADNADNIYESAELFLKLSKQVAVLFDGDEPGRREAEKTKNVCATFTYHSNRIRDPALEEVLLFGFPKQDVIFKHYYSSPDCENCEKRNNSCWKQKGTCELGDRDKRKKFLHSICLKHYEENKCLPPAFKILLQQLDSAKSGTIHKLQIEP